MVQVGISVDPTAFTALTGYITKLIANISTGVPTALNGLMKEARGVAADATHQGSTRRLFQAWKAEQNGNVFSLFNTMPYAAEEFGRGGTKTAGNPPLGPHNVIPVIMDLLSSNVEPVVTKALMNNLTR
jgi:hypothetical protein